MDPTWKVTTSALASLGAPPQLRTWQFEDCDYSVSQSDDSQNDSVAGSSPHTQGSEASFSGKAALAKGSYDFDKKWTVTNEQLFGPSELFAKEQSPFRGSLSSFIVSDSEEDDSEDFDYSSIVRRIEARGIYSAYVNDFMSPGHDVTTTDGDVTASDSDVPAPVNYMPAPVNNVAALDNNVTAAEDGMSRAPRTLSHSMLPKPSTASPPPFIDLSSEHSDPGDSVYGSYPGSTCLEDCECGSPPLCSSDDEVEQDVAGSSRRPARPWWRRTWAVVLVVCVILLVPAPGSEYWKIRREVSALSTVESPEPVRVTPQLGTRRCWDQACWDDWMAWRADDLPRLLGDLAYA